MKLGIIGVGVVGTACYDGFEYLGHECVGYDIVDKPNKTMVSLDKMMDCDMIFMCLPTAQQFSGAANMACYDEIMEKIQDYKNIVVIKSTVPIGTNKKYTDMYGLKIVSNPEFLTEKNAKLDFLNEDRYIIGCDTQATGEEVAKIFKPLKKPIVLTNAKTAEFIKYVSNCFFATKVTFANEMFDITKGLGINWDSVKNILYLDHRIGKDHLGVSEERGYGGMCLPKDVNAFRYMFKGKVPLIDTVNMINERVRKK